MEKILNAEGLPIESIDRIEVSLNQKLNQFIDFDKRNFDKNKYLRMWFSRKYGLRWFIDIQAQMIYPSDIRNSIANALYVAMKEGFIRLPLELSLPFIYMKPEYFITNIRQIEFAFDFKPEAIHVIDPSLLNRCKTTFYSNDYRWKKGRQTRYSFIDLYYRNDYLLEKNKIRHDAIEKNPFSWRIEFFLSRNNNTKLLTLDNLSGTYHNVISRYIPYLGVIYHNYFYNKIFVDVKDHPYFAQIKSVASQGTGTKTRYTGAGLGKTTAHKPSKEEDDFYNTMMILKYPVKTLVLQALLNTK
jgi:hypothetical protein